MLSKDQGKGSKVLITLPGIPVLQSLILKRDFLSKAQINKADGVKTVNFIPLRDSTPPSY